MGRFNVAIAVALALAGCSGRGSLGAYLEPSGPIRLGDRISIQLGTASGIPVLGGLLPSRPLRLVALTIANRTTGNRVTPQLEPSGTNTFAFIADSRTLPDLPSDPSTIEIYDVLASLDSGEQDGYELDLIQDPEARLPGPRMFQAAPSTVSASGRISPPGGNLRPSRNYSYLASVAIVIAGSWGVPDPRLASASVDSAGNAGLVPLPPGTGFVRYTVTGAFPKIADVAKRRVYRPVALEIVLTETDPATVVETEAR